MLDYVAPGPPRDWTRTVGEAAFSVFFGTMAVLMTALAVRMLRRDGYVSVVLLVFVPVAVWQLCRSLGHVIRGR